MAQIPQGFKFDDEQTAAPQGFTFDDEDTQKTSYLRGLGQTISQGTTLGFSDEIVGMLVASAAEIRDVVTPGNDGMSFNEVRQDVTGLERESQQQFAQENPKTALGAEVVGGLATGGAGAAKVLGLSTVKNLPKVTKYAIGGAIPGAIYGTGAAEEGDRIVGGAVGGAMGAGFGAGLPVVGKQAVKVVKWTGDKIGSAFSTHETKALRSIREAFDRDQVSIDQALKNLDELGDQATLGDIGGANVSLVAEDLASKPGIALNEAKQTLVARAKGQGNRIIDAVKSKLSSKADDILEAAEEIKLRMRTEASPLYDQAYATPLVMTAPLKNLLNNPLVKPLLNKAIKTAKSDVTLDDALKSGLNAENPNMVVWDYLKRELADEGSAAARGGKDNQGRIYKGIEKRLLAELDDQVPEYGQARAIWSDNAGQLDALDKGKNIFRSLAKDEDFTIAEFNKLPKDQQELFRLGAGKTIINMIRNTKDTLQGTPPASLRSRIFGSQAQRDTLKAIFPDAGEFDDFAKLMKAEGKFQENMNNILGNSRTAIRQAAGKDAGIDPAIAGDVANIATGDVRGALSILGRFKRSGRKSDPAVDAEMAKRFFTTDAKTIKETLRGIEQQQNILPKWAQSVLKMKPDNMQSWLKNEANRLKLEGYISGGSGTAGVAANR